MVFLNLHCKARFLPFIMAAFFITRGVSRVMQMLGKLQTLGIIWGERQTVIRILEVQQNAGHFLVCESASN